LAGVSVAGLATPPLEPCLRTLWPELVPDDLVERAYALDSAVQELIFVSGPLAVAGGLALGLHPSGVLVAQAFLGLAGVAVMASAVPSRAWRGVARAGHWLGPLHRRGLVVLLAAMIGAGFAVGTLNVYVVAYAEHHPVPGGAPTLLALNAAGAFAGALAYGARRWPLSAQAKAVLFMAGLIVAYALLALHLDPAPMAVVAVFTGLFLAPLLTVTFVLIGELAPVGTTTEAFAWLITLFALGISAGSAVEGVALGSGSGGWSAGIGSVGAAAGMVLLLAGYRSLQPD
jgi:predicted MFS family arabinose efflux permease